MRARLGAAAIPAILLSASLGIPGHVAAAQDAPEWQVTFTPYAWAAGLNGRVGTAGNVIDVDLSTREILDKLDIAVMGLLEAQRGRWLGRLDATYVAVSDRKEIAGDLGNVLLEQEQGMLQPEIGYTMIVARWGGIDTFAGGRYWHLKVDVSASSSGAGGGGGRDSGRTIDVASGDRKWFDGVAGARVRVRPVGRWGLFAKADLGAGGSKLTWQALAGVAYDFTSCCSAAGLYRRLDVDYDRDDVVNDTSMSGFALGLEIRF